MTSRRLLPLFAPVSLVVLAGCLSTPVDTPPDAGFLDPDATGTVALGAVAFDAGAREATAATGEVDQATGAWMLGTQSGTLSEDRTQVTLDGGGIVTLEAGTTEFSVIFEATPTGGGQTVGVFGVPTHISDLATLGDVTYSGTATLLIEDGNAVFNLDGTATVEASFGDGTVTTTIDELSGEREVGLTAPEAVSDVAVLAVTGSTIEGATFSGGTPSLASDQISDLSGLEDSSLEGAFFGPDADEVGAALVIDDSASGGVTVFGTILAD